MIRLLIAFTLYFYSALVCSQNTAQLIHEHLYPESVEITHTKAIDAKISYFGNYYIIQAKINGKGPYPFLFDTGATENYIRYALAEELELEHVHTKKRSVLSSIQTIKVHQSLFLAESLQLGDVIFHQVAFQSGESEENEAKAFQEIGVAGIIGITTFEPVLLTLDLGNERIILSDNKLHKKLHGVIPLQTTKKLVPIILGNVHAEYYQGSHSFIIDSGNYSNFHMYLCSEIQQEPAHHEKFTLKSKDFMMNEKIDYFTTLKGSVSLGEASFINPKITYSLELCSENWYFARDALIGANTLKKIRMSIDQKNRLVQIYRKQ